MTTYKIRTLRIQVAEKKQFITLLRHLKTPSQSVRINVFKQKDILSLDAGKS